VAQPGRRGRLPVAGGHRNRRRAFSVVACGGRDRGLSVLKWRRYSGMANLRARRPGGFVMGGLPSRRARREQTLTIPRWVGVRYHLFPYRHLDERGGPCTEITPRDFPRALAGDTRELASHEPTLRGSRCHSRSSTTRPSRPVGGDAPGGRYPIPFRVGKPRAARSGRVSAGRS